MNLVEKLNMSLESDHINENAVVFSARNLKEIHECKKEYIEEALYNADYFEDRDYSDEDLSALLDVINDFGSETIKNNVAIIDKQIWFDPNPEA